MIEGPAIGDAFGMALVDGLSGSNVWHWVERDDGHLDGADVAVFFRPPDEWPEGEAAALDLVEGAVLDVGVGAGRYAVVLQERGHRVVGLDNSPGVIEAAGANGVGETFAGTVYDYDGGPFDTVLLCGHNLGLLANPEEAPRLLRRIRQLLNPGGRIVGTCRDPGSTAKPEHVAYAEWNRQRGRPPGQLTIRVRYKNVATEWFDYWLLSARELEEVASAAGFHLTETIPIANGSYIAVLE